MRVPSGKRREPYSGLVLLDAAPVEQRVGRVAEALYRLSPEGAAGPLAQTRNWDIVDSVFSKARGSYEETLEALAAQPETYRLETVRRRKLAAIEASLESSRSRTETSHRRDSELEAFLDPFLLPVGWTVEVDGEGRPVYFNSSTRQVLVGEEPAQIWEEKLDRLARLALSEDGSRFIYKESDEDRRRRNRATDKLRERGERELSRRRETPTEMEQVEDVLVDLIRRVVKDHHHRLRMEKLAAHELSADRTHPSCRGFPMRKLPNQSFAEKSRLEVTDSRTDIRGRAVVTNVGTVVRDLSDSCRIRAILNIEEYSPNANRSITDSYKFEKELLSSLSTALGVPQSWVEMEQILSTPSQLQPDQTTPIQDSYDADNNKLKAKFLALREHFARDKVHGMHDFLSALSKMHNNAASRIFHRQSVQHYKSICFVIHVPRSVRQIDGLSSLNSQDFGRYIMHNRKLLTLRNDESSWVGHIKFVSYTVVEFRAFLGWIDFHLPLLHPAFYGYSANKHLSMSVKESYDVLESNILYPLEGLPQTSREIIDTIGVNRNSKTLDVQKYRHFRQKVKNLTAGDIDTLQRLYKVAESELSSFRAKNSNVHSGPSRTELYLINKRDAAFRLLSTAKKWLFQHEEDSIPTVRLLTSVDVQEESPIESSHFARIRAMAKRNDAGKSLREVREREKLIKSKVSGQYDWMVRILIEQSDNPSKFEILFRENLQNRESALEQVDKAIGMAEKIRRQIKESDAAQRVSRITERRLVGYHRKEKLTN